ncbi:hypothetical protein BD311DRAFT_277688 [Dichomitus squalens]|uniref:Uncharacterized protein n=1 Tax=Dichomitus squalens TaxID=114155 RepID=A0A4Q9MSK1_9APHY|nr:hypothetical protein BD311DRAFT_277688 [Dichomitus squalens]
MSLFGVSVRCYAPSGKKTPIRLVRPASPLVFSSWSTLSTRISHIKPLHDVDVTLFILFKSTEAVGGRDSPHRHASRLGRARPRSLRDTEMYKSRCVDHAFCLGLGFHAPLMSIPVPQVDFSRRNAGDQFLHSDPPSFPQAWDSVSLSSIVYLRDVMNNFLTATIVLAAHVSAGVAPVPVPLLSPRSIAIAARITTALPAM